MQNIIICGEGGSGKTTLLKALIARIPEEIAITTNEETAELYLEGRNVIQRECILNRNEDKNIDLELLSKHSLVMSNDVIIIGELKGAEANSTVILSYEDHSVLKSLRLNVTQEAVLKGE
jgi:pilus assembly protein CpaF